MPTAKILYTFKNIAFFLIVSAWFLGGCVRNDNMAAKNKSITLAQNSSLKNAIPLAIGTNLNGISDWSTELPFIDHFKSSRKWLTQCVPSDPGCQGQWHTGEYEKLNLDENGWVKSLPNPEDPPIYTRASALLLWDIPNRYPSGKYIVFYEGEGKIEYRGAARKIQEESKLGRDILEVDSSKKGIVLTITETDPQKTGNYIRNIQFIEAEHENIYQKSERFNPVFIDKIKPFKALRFMNWMQTSDSQQKEWSDRPKMEPLSYTLKGVPLEIMINLSNKIKADPWFNMPHQATDDYMTNFAQLVKSKLDPKLKIYVELSNEVWNPQFEQYHYAVAQGKARWGEDKWDAHFHWYGMRTAQMCEIWKNVFKEKKEQVICVISTQTGWKGIEKQILECPYWVAEGNSPCYQYGIDAYAITGYFSGSLGNPENAVIVESWFEDLDGGMSKAFQQLREGGFLAKNIGNLKETLELFNYYADVARKHELQLIAYEGGQHIVGRGKVMNNSKFTDFFIRINREQKMYDLYTELLNGWQKAGGTLFMHYLDIGTPSRYGSWGALEYVEQAGSPKYNALIDFIEQHP